MSSERDQFHASCRAAGEPTAAAAMVFHNGLVLVERGPKGNRAPGIPGGKREWGETPLQTAIRELHEETGVRVEHGSFLMKEECGGHLTAIYLFDCNDPPALADGAEWVHPTMLLTGSRFPETYARCFAHPVYFLSRFRYVGSTGRILR